MAGRFFVTLSINTVLQMAHEVLPTQLRARGAALANSLGGLCTVASPYVAYSVSECVSVTLPAREGGAYSATSQSPPSRDESLCDSNVTSFGVTPTFSICANMANMRSFYGRTWYFCIH